MIFFMQGKWSSVLGKAGASMIVAAWFLKASKSLSEGFALAMPHMTRVKGSEEYSQGAEKRRAARLPIAFEPLEAYNE